MCAVTSNCVINLVPDKGRVFAEVARVLRPGGRLVISDIVLDGPLPESVASDVFAYVGCVSGAMERRPYFDLLHQAGLTEIEILRDVDYLASVAETEPAWLAELTARTKVDPAEVVGRVRSITYRARKPAAAERCCDSTCCA
jgi:SAM-dependent methyltransferase